MKRAKYPIHPDFKRWAHMHPPLHTAPLPVTQRMLGLLFDRERSTTAVSVQRMRFPARDGAEIRALLYAPASVVGPLPCLVYLHGGGYVFPAAPYQYRLARKYAARLGCRVLFVEYRLAPKHPFPTAPEDCYAAYCSAIEQADRLNIDTARMSVIGDSAGGCLATVVCMMAKAHGQILPRSQVMTYPAVGLGFETASMRRFTDTPMCNSADAKRYESLYVQDPNAGKREYRTPIEADDLSGMPPAYIETAEFDCLRDGGILYAEKLQRFGVPVTLHNTKGTIHGFDIELESAIVRACVEQRIAFIQSNWRQA